MFPTRVRLSGVAIGTQIGFAIGGFARRRPRRSRAKAPTAGCRSRPTCSASSVHRRHRDRDRAGDRARVAARDRRPRRAAPRDAQRREHRGGSARRRAPAWADATRGRRWRRVRSGTMTVSDGAPAAPTRLRRMSAARRRRAARPRLLRRRTGTDRGPLLVELRLPRPLGRGRRPAAAHHRRGRGRPRPGAAPGLPARRARPRLRHPPRPRGGRLRGVPRAAARPRDRDRGRSARPRRRRAAGLRDRPRRPRHRDHGR